MITLNLTAAITPSQSEILAVLARAPDSMMQALAKGVAKGSQTLLGLVVRDRFTGKGPFAPSLRKLGVVTGRLRRSLTHSEPRVSGDGEMTVAMGSNVKYFRVHEFGFEGSVRVKAHNRKGRPVREHARSVRIQARAPLRAGIEQHGAGAYSRALSRQIEAYIETLG